MGVIELIGAFRDKIQTKDIKKIESAFPIAERILSEVLRRFQKIMKESRYTELKFNSYDLSETANELQEAIIDIQRQITVENLIDLKLSIDETVDYWNKHTDFVNTALLISQKFSLLGYLVKLIEDNSKEETFEQIIVDILKSLI